MATANSSFSPVDLLKEPILRVTKNWYWFVILGVLFLLGGILGLANPFASSLSVTVVTGATFLVVGIVQIIQAFRLKTSWDSTFWTFFLLGVLEVILGYLLLKDPVSGMMSLTLVLAALIAAMGVVRIYYSLKLRPVKGWGWLLASGIVSLLLAIVIMSDFSSTSMVTLGILLSIELIFSGVSLIALGIQMKSISNDVKNK